MLLVGRQERHPACKNWVVRYWHGYLFEARCKWFAYGPADATAIHHPLCVCVSSGNSPPGQSQTKGLKMAVLVAVVHHVVPICTSCNTQFQGPHKSAPPPNSILIRWTIFAGLIRATDTDIQTQRSCYMATDRIYHRWCRIIVCKIFIQPNVLSKDKQGNQAPDSSFLWLWREKSLIPNTGYLTPVWSQQSMNVHRGP